MNARWRKLPRLLKATGFSLAAVGLLAAGLSAGTYTVSAANEWVFGPVERAGPASTLVENCT